MRFNRQFGDQSERCTVYAAEGKHSLANVNAGPSLFAACITIRMRREQRSDLQRPLRSAPVHGLQLVHLSVDAIPGKKGSVIALFYDHSVLQDQDVIHVPDG